MKWGFGHCTHQGCCRCMFSETWTPGAQSKERAAFLLGEPSWGRLLTGSTKSVLDITGLILQLEPQHYCGKEQSKEKTAPMPLGPGFSITSHQASSGRLGQARAARARVWPWPVCRSCPRGNTLLCKERRRKREEGREGKGKKRRREEEEGKVEERGGKRGRREEK